MSRPTFSTSFEFGLSRRASSTIPARSIQNLKEYEKERARTNQDAVDEDISMSEPTTPLAIDDEGGRFVLPPVSYPQPTQPLAASSSSTLPPPTVLPTSGWSSGSRTPYHVHQAQEQGLVPASSSSSSSAQPWQPAPQSSSTSIPPGPVRTQPGALTSNPLSATPSSVRPADAGKIATATVPSTVTQQSEAPSASPSAPQIQETNSEIGAKPPVAPQQSKPTSAVTPLPLFATQPVERTTSEIGAKPSAAPQQSKPAGPVASLPLFSTQPAERTTSESGAGKAPTLLFSFDAKPEPKPDPDPEWDHPMMELSIRIAEELKARDARSDVRQESRASKNDEEELQLREEQEQENMRQRVKRWEADGTLELMHFLRETESLVTKCDPVPAPGDHFKQMQEEKKKELTDDRRKSMLYGRPERNRHLYEFKRQNAGPPRQESPIKSDGRPRTQPAMATGAVPSRGQTSASTSRPASSRPRSEDVNSAPKAPPPQPPRRDETHPARKQTSTNSGSQSRPQPTARTNTVPNRGRPSASTNAADPSRPGPEGVDTSRKTTRPGQPNPAFAGGSNDSTPPVKDPRIKIDRSKRDNDFKEYWLHELNCRRNAVKAEAAMSAARRQPKYPINDPSVAQSLLVTGALACIFFFMLFGELFLAVLLPFAVCIHATIDWKNTFNWFVENTRSWYKRESAPTRSGWFEYCFNFLLLVALISLMIAKVLDKLGYTINGKPFSEGLVEGLGVEWNEFWDNVAGGYRGGERA